jgi:hypothetical protein
MRQNWIKVVWRERDDLAAEMKRSLAESASRHHLRYIWQAEPSVIVGAPKYRAVASTPFAAALRDF